MHLSTRAVIVCCAVLVIAASSAQGFVPKVDYSTDGRKAAVKVNNRPAVIFRMANGGLTPEQRARITTERLKPFAENGGWTTLKVKPVGKTRAQVMAGDKLICIATAADAKRVGMSATALASTWAANLRKLFGMPPLTVQPTEITVPENESRSVDIGGALSGPVAVTDAFPTVATASLHQTKRAVLVQGKSVGRSAVQVNCEGCSATLVVNVRRYAGKLSRTGLVEVTGNPAPGWLLDRAASRKAPSTIAVEPGASADYGKPKLPTGSLRPGACVKSMVPVKVKGPGLLPVNLMAPVEVCNRQLPPKPVEGLFYSNNPEQMKSFGTLFAGQFATGDRTRLLYHHQNMMATSLQFTIEVINASDSAARFHAVSGSTSPIVDTVVVGYLAGRSFIKDYLDNIGQIFEIPAMSRLILYTDRVGVKQTVSGIMEMRLLSGQDVYLRVRADQPGLMSVSNGMTGVIGVGSIPRKLSDHVYSTPVKELDASYAVGDKWAFIRIGKHAITDASQSRKLDGNYGVTYNINVKVSNPSGDPKTIKVLFEPTAGPASGLFLVGGKLIGAKIVVPPNEFEITSVRLAPGESRSIRLTTIPLAGSAYPATIIVKS